ncbi:MAG TPA: hypothetical protein VMY40_15640 [Anaerolineae bacterium]|nr:hypothetical protein [Anaerolineae bacterium]
MDTIQRPVEAIERTPQVIRRGALGKVYALLLRLPDDALADPRVRGDQAAQPGTAGAAAAGHDGPHIETTRPAT